MRLPRAAMAVALALLLASTAHAAVDPRPRAAALATVGNVLAVSVADGGNILAATDDPGSSLSVAPEDPPGNENTWFAWTPGGTGLQSGSSDMDTCATTRIGDMCKTPAVAAAMSGDGKRFVIGANPVDSPVDTAQGLLLFGTTTAGVRVRMPVANPILFVATDTVGRNVAVVERVPGVGGQSTTVVEAFAFDGNAVSPYFGAPYAINAPATGLAVNEAGTRFVVGADKPYRFLFGSSPPLGISGSQGTVGAVGIGQGGPAIVVAGMSTGEVVMFTDAAPGTVAFSQKPATSPIQSIAVQPLASKPLVAIGDASGKIHLFRYDTDNTPAAQLVRTIAVASGGLAQMAFSTDGSTLAIRTASDLHLYQSTGTDLVPLWKDTVTATSVSLSGNGDLVAAGVGAGVRVYDAVHGLTGTATASTGLPGQSYDVKVRYTNTGTRSEVATLQPVAPDGWVVTVTPATLTLEPSATGEATVRVNVPATAAPGLAPLQLRHQLASGPSGFTPLSFTVGVQVSLAVRAEGAASVAINPGGTVLLKARIENRGNQELATDVRVASDPPGWTAVVSPGDVRVAPGRNATVAITLTAASSAKEGDRGHVALYTSAKPDEVLHLYATVGAKFGVAVSAPPGIAVGPGNQTEIEVTVQNKGNTVDSFDLQALEVPVGWTAIFDGGGSLVQVLDLEPGDSSKAILTLRAPADAEPGQRFRIQVQALSQGKTDVHAERPVQVTVGDHAEPPTDDTPGPSLLLLLVAAIGAALWQRSRSRRN